jgi:hypothetical protein
VRVNRAITIELLRDVAVGAALGTALLGVGGRIAMRVVALSLGQALLLNAGGTLTVIASGAAAGAAGALLHALSRVVTRRIHGPWARPARVTVFAALLALVTARGLSGSPGPTWLFWLLVAAYGAALDYMLSRRAPSLPPLSLPASHFGG